MTDSVDMEIRVLNGGYVRLVDSMGTDLSIVRSARVSHDAAWRTGQDAGKDEKLIRYLMKNRHTSPFEAVVFTFEVKAPIFVFRQWHRHRTWSFNEVSARYSELPEEFYVPAPAMVGQQSTINKQARDVGAELTPDELRQVHLRIGEFEDFCRAAFVLYRDLLAAGWPRELARAVLPVATYSKMFATVDLHNLFHFLGLRLHPHAQYEIRVYAQAMLDLIRPIVPVAVKAWEDLR